MSELTRSVGTPFEITHDGKTYKVSLFRKAEQALWTRRIQKVARDIVKQQKADFGLTTEEYVELLKDVANREAKGEFDFAGKYSMDLLNSVKGQVCVLAILTGTSEEEAEKLFLATPQECAVVLSDVYKESFREQVEAAQVKADEPNKKKARRKS